MTGPAGAVNVRRNGCRTSKVPDMVTTRVSGHTAVMNQRSEAEIVSIEQAKACGLRWYFTGAPCKRGHIAKRSLSNRWCRKCNDESRNREALRAKDRRRNAKPERKAAGRASYLRNIEKRRAYYALRYPAEAEARKARAVAWARANPAKRRKLTAQARRWIKQATPSWLTSEQKAAIHAIYMDAAAREGDLQVDHIVPIRGKEVCGLHVPWNLRVISGEENRKKGNRL